MIKQYKVLVSKAAAEKLDAIYERSLLFRSISSSKSLYERLKEAILSLNEFPERFQALDSSFGSVANFRRMIVDKYLVLYRIGEDEVWVEDILYISSNIDFTL